MPLFSLVLNSQKRTSCSKSVTGLLPGRRQGNTRTRSHRWLQLDDNKSAASCKQGRCKLTLKTFYNFRCNFHGFDAGNDEGNRLDAR